MKRVCKTHGLPALWFVLAVWTCSRAYGFRPDEWVYHDWPTVYALNEARWYYMDPGSAFWTYDTLVGQWAYLGTGATRDGWVFYQWPYGFAIDSGRWLYMDEAGLQWCFSFVAGQWSRFGTAPGSNASNWSPMPDYQRQIVADPPLGQHEYSVAVDGYGTLRFLLNLPDNYDTQSEWPAMLFLHGSGEVGSDASVLRTLGPSGYAEGLSSFPFIVISPQLDGWQWWDAAELDQLLDHVVRYYRVDQDRVAVTGMSLGGYGSWSLAAAYPYRFSCVVPVAGGGDPSTACSIAHLPAWVFHGAQDSVVPLSEAQAMVNALEGCGGAPLLTVYPDIGHPSWTPTYVNASLYQWMSTQVRVRP